MKRWDLVVSSKSKDEKYRNTRVGAVFQKDDGRLSIALDKGVSITGMDGVFITAFVPREREQGGGGPRGGAHEPAPSYGGDDTDLPF